MDTYTILECYEKSEFVFAESIHIYIYTYEYIYDPGIIREIRICIRREYTDIYIYTYIHMNTYMILEIYEKSKFVFVESIHIYIYTYEYIYDPGIIR